MKAARKKRQHYTPQLHLRRFVGESPKGMVWTHDMRSSRSRPSLTSETGFSSNFYSVRDSSGVWRDDIDDWLTQIEQEASPGYEQLTSGVLPVGRDKVRFAEFVATLYLRSPSLVRAAAAGYANFVQLWINAEWKTRERFEKRLDQYDAQTGSVTEGRDELWRFHNDKSKHRVEVDQSRGLSVLKSAPAIAEILASRNWMLARPQSGYFISSDCPVYRFTAQSDEYGAYGDGGFANPAAEITLPISPHLMLFISGLQMPPGDMWLPEDSVKVLNEMRAAGADRFLFAHEKSPMFENLGERFKEPGIRFDVDGGGPYAEVVVKRALSSK